MFSVPVAIVSVVDHDRIWFKAHHGTEVTQIGRDPGLCASAILQDDVWVIEDAVRDPRTLANPLVAGEFGLQFYAGVPLRTPDGYNLGTFCILDREPREFSADDVRALRGPGRHRHERPGDAAAKPGSADCGQQRAPARRRCAAALNACAV